MRGANKSTEVRPVSARQSSILIPTLVGLAIAVAGGFVTQQACARLLDAVLVRGADVARLAGGVALLALGGATGGLYVHT